MAYELNFSPSAARTWRKLPLDVRLFIGPHLDELKKVPRPSGVKKLKGFKNLYRIRIGDYRVIYEILDTSHEIFVTKVANRSEAY